MLRLVTLYQISCKGTTKFADVQILRGKSFRSFNSFKRDKVIFCLEILGNLNKMHFLSFGVLWAFLGLSLVSPWSLAAKRQGGERGTES